MQPYGAQAMEPMHAIGTPPPQRTRMQPIGAGRGMAQQQQGGFGGRGGNGGGGYGYGYQQGGGVAQHDFGRVTANNIHVDWEALGTLRR